MKMKNKMKFSKYLTPKLNVDRSLFLQPNHFFYQNNMAKKVPSLKPLRSDFVNTKCRKR